MYCVTEWIDGILHYKMNPTDEWRPATIGMLNERLYQAEMELAAANDRIERFGDIRGYL